MFKFFTKLIAIAMFVFGVFLLAYGFTTPVITAGGPLIGGSLLFIGSFFVWRLPRGQKEPSNGQSTSEGDRKERSSPEEKDEEQIYCPSCGKLITQDANYCPNCGVEIES